MQTKPKARLRDIIANEADGELLIYDLSINKAFCLNQTSALVYQLSDGNRTVSEIGHILSKKLKMPVTEDFIWLALNELNKEDLLEDSDSLALPFMGLTRREIVKRVGLASMITLPLVSSIIAPSAV